MVKGRGYTNPDCGWLTFDAHPRLLDGRQDDVEQILPAKTCNLTAGTRTDPQVGIHRPGQHLRAAKVHSDREVAAHKRDSTRDQFGQLSEVIRKFVADSADPSANMVGADGRRAARLHPLQKPPQRLPRTHGRK